MQATTQSSGGRFHRLVEGHYYTCTAQPLGSSDSVEVTHDAIAAGNMRVDRMSGGDVLVERTWRQVRSNPSDIYLIRFPELGHLSISQDAAHDSRISSGQFVITYGNRPFKAKALGPSGGRYSQLDIVVPSHILRNILPEVDLVCGQTFSLDGGAAIARTMIEDMISRSARIEPALAARLVSVGVEAIASDVKIQMQDNYSKFCILRSDLDIALKFIEKNFTVPGLTGEYVARYCRISRRHLYNLMASMNTTFSEYLWERRLLQAHEWICDPKFMGFNLTHIAYMSGFQSGSHFSKLYKERFGASPRDIRRQLFQ